MSKVWKPQDIQVYIDWIQTIRDEAQDKLSSWESDFIDSVEGRLAFKHNLSERQAEILEGIYAKHT